MKKAISIFFMCFLTSFLLSYEWPLETDGTAKISSRFAVFRGGSLSRELIFSSEGNVKAIEDGTVVLVMENHMDESCFFPSSMGKALIISHASGVMSVYSGLKQVETSFGADLKVLKNTYLGESGESAWGETDERLGISLLDKTNNTAVDPCLVLPKNGEEEPLKLWGVVIKDKDDSFKNASSSFSYRPGTYKIYAPLSRNPPSKVTVSVNGKEGESLNFSVINQHKGELCLFGGKYYNATSVYPGGELVLLGEAEFLQGINKLHIIISGTIDSAISANYSVLAH